VYSGATGSPEMVVNEMSRSPIASYSASHSASRARSSSSSRSFARRRSSSSARCSATRTSSFSTCPSGPRVRCLFLPGRLPHRGAHDPSRHLVGRRRSALQRRHDDSSRIAAPGPSRHARSQQPLLHRVPHPLLQPLPPAPRQLAARAPATPVPRPAAPPARPPPPSPPSSAAPGSATPPQAPRRPRAVAPPRPLAPASKREVEVEVEAGRPAHAAQVTPWCAGMFFRLRPGAGAASSPPPGQARAPGRSALFTTNRSAASMRPAFMVWMESPDSGTRTTTVLSAAAAMSSSLWPTPTVSTRTRRNRTPSTSITSRVAAARPPSAPGSPWTG
jgi:hypothetical protein